jgi:hypothetical protein
LVHRIRQNSAAQASARRAHAGPRWGKQLSLWKKAARLSETEESESAAPEHSKLEKGFLRSVMFEAVLGVAVLLVTAILVFQTPARSHPVMTFSRAGSALVQKGN